jgi:hypothetical protein
MHATYKPHRWIKIVAAMALPFVLTACDSFMVKPQKPEVVVEKIKPKPVEKIVTTEKLCACEQPIVKQVVKFVDKPCPEASKAKPINNPIIRTAYSDKLIVGRVEYVVLSANGLPMKARIDTGAKTSSLNALDLTEFERDGKKWVRFAVMNPATKRRVYLERKVERYVRIKQMEADYQRRPVVKMALQLGKVDESVEITLTDRSDYVYQILVGRNFLLDRMLVDVSQKYIAQSQGQ